MEVKYYILAGVESAESWNGTGSQAGRSIVESADTTSTQDDYKCARGDIMMLWSRSCAVWTCDGLEAFDAMHRLIVLVLNLKMRQARSQQSSDLDPQVIKHVSRY